MQLCSLFYFLQLHHRSDVFRLHAVKDFSVLFDYTLSFFISLLHDVPSHMMQSRWSFVCVLIMGLFLYVPFSALTPNLPPVGL